MALSDIAEQLDQADPTLARYNRQMLWPQIGIEGQKKLKASKVLLVGCGALGTVLGNLLATAGEEGNARLWKVPDGKQVAKLVHENSTVGTERAVLRLLGFNEALAHAGLVTATRGPAGG